MELFLLIALSLTLLLLGVPVAFAFGASGLLIGSYLSVFGGEEFEYLLTFLPNRIDGIMNNQTLISVPLFIFMGMILEKSGIAEKLIQSIAKLFGNIGGGMAIGVIGVGVLLAASTGIVGATVVMMSAIAIPVMVKAGYNKKLTAGVVAASGTLGQIIPPSIILIILSDVLRVSVRDLFTAAILPSIMLIGFYVIFIIIIAIFAPHITPALKETHQNKREIFIEVLKMAIPPIVLILLVLGSILNGFAEPTEAAAVGVLGAILLSFCYKRLNWKLLIEASRSSVIFCGMVFMILIGATCFTLVFNELGGDKVVLDFFSSYLDSPLSFVIFSMIIIFILGFFIDFFEICYIVLPILAGIASHYQVDMLWFGILIAVNLQTSFLTPPFGFSIFFLKSAIGDLISIADIYKGVVPFILLQLLVLVVLFFFPDCIISSDEFEKLFGF